MNEVSIVGAVVIGLLAGWIAGQVMGREHGLITNLLVGVVGAFLGAPLASTVRFGFVGFRGSPLVSSVRAIMLLAIVRMPRGRRAIYPTLSGLFVDRPLPGKRPIQA